MGDNSLVSLDRLRELTDLFPTTAQVFSLGVKELVPQVDGRAVGFPLRFGTNSLSFNRGKISGTSDLSGV